MNHDIDGTQPLVTLPPPEHLWAAAGARRGEDGGRCSLGTHPPPSAPTPAPLLPAAGAARAASGSAALGRGRLGSWARTARLQPLSSLGLRGRAEGRGYRARPLGGACPRRLARPYSADSTSPFPPFPLLHLSPTYLCSTLLLLLSCTPPHSAFASLYQPPPPSALLPSFLAPTSLCPLLSSSLSDLLLSPSPAPSPFSCWPPSSFSLLASKVYFNLSLGVSDSIRPFLLGVLWELV